MPRIKKDQQTPEQIVSAERYRRLYELARLAGFDDDALVYSEFCLMPFFELIVDQCARIAETQSRVYTGENNESRGAMDAATAIHSYGRKIGNE